MKSKMAKERALKEVCPRCPIHKKCGLKDCPDQCSDAGKYIDGYEQAEKDMIERACNYLYDHRQGNKDVYQFIGLFRLAMEEGL